MSLKKLELLKYQIIVLLNLKKASNRNLAVNMRNQQIQFCNAIVLKIFDIAKKFAIDKSWRSCFLAGKEFYARYLLQNSSQFKLLKKFGEKLVRNLEKFFGGNSINPSWLVVFNKIINLFSLGTLDWDTGCYVTLNHVLSYLKKLII